MTGAERHHLVVVANRLPVSRADNAGAWETSPGGLVRAMMGVLRSKGGAWVGWPGYTGEAPEPFEHDSVHLVPVPLSDQEHEAFYEGFANEALWPLYHDAIRNPSFEQAWWEAYVVVNRRFAEAAAEVVADDGVVWVHDYHLQLVPEMLRELRPDVRIGFFLHIPFPPQELFMRLPWREEILRGLLAADVVGFQRPVAADNFAAVARRLVDAEGQPPRLTWGGRTIEVGAHPISIDVDEFDEIARRSETARRAVTIRHRLGNPDVVLLGIDRLDYTKGIDLRLEAYEELLRSGELDGRSCVMVQIAVPTRERIDHYRDERERVEQLVGRINGDFGSLGYPCVHYLHQSLDLDWLVPLYQVGDVMLVTPLRDGMNLVAKEYAASRIDERGVLVLSEFAGAADELTDALLVNPHDHGAVRRAILEAVSKPTDVATKNMIKLRESVRRSDVRHWAAQFLALLGEEA